MCGIIGILSEHSVTQDILNSLKRIEYRGYDSSGVALLLNGKLEVRRTVGGIDNLTQLLKQSPLNGKVGIGHTRWATHGKVNEANAHPHQSHKVCVVHNGTITNSQILKEELHKFNYDFNSDTDTEVIACLIDHFLKENPVPKEAVQKALKKLEGSYALAILFSGEENLIIGARKDSPLVVGYGKEGLLCLGSDIPAIANVAQECSFLEENDIVELTKGKVIIFNNNKPVQRKKTSMHFTSKENSKGNYKYFMEKEIFEQPSILRDTFSHYFDPSNHSLTIKTDKINFKNLNKLIMVGCGTAYYACLVAKYWIEKNCKVHVEVDVASEFRYRDPVVSSKDVAIFVSQSGETADTLASLRFCKEKKIPTISIVNVPQSSIARESSDVIMTYAGEEVAVASTKAFTSQLMVLGCLAIKLAEINGTQSKETILDMKRHMSQVSGYVQEILKSSDDIKEISSQIIKGVKGVMYLGRGSSYPIALEGALKFKEISYIHAEAYPAGEMKHGPLALIEDGMPVFVLSPYDEHFKKTITNVEEVIARGGKVVLITDVSAPVDKLKTWKTIKVPKVDNFIQPFAYTIPVQLLAYHTAVLRNNNVDKPRNLAKSVTVE